MPGLVIAIVLLTAMAAGAQPAPLTPGRLDTWATAAEGPFVSPEWQRYPGSAPPALKFPPTVVVDAGRPVLEIKTENESVKLGRAVRIDVAKTPRLVWEWKAVVLPQGGDVRQPRRNDQAARVVVVFEGLIAILYVWDTTAPVAVEVQPDTLGDLGRRALIVIRSGPAGVGQWHRETRDVQEDYVRLFGGAPGPVQWVGLESHSDDVHSHSTARFGLIRFEGR
jgi:hypothetical protein